MVFNGKIPPRTAVLISGQFRTFPRCLGKILICRQDWIWISLDEIDLVRGG